MKRTVRNGLAITGMAGGIFFLGQAVASADTTSANQNIEPTTAASTTTGLGGGKSSATTNTDATNIAANADITAVSNDVNTGNTVAVDNSRGNTTVSAGGLAPTVAVDQSNDTKVAVESGDVDKSGNPMVNSGHGTAGDTVTANQGIEPTTAASTTGLVGGNSSATTNTDATNIAANADITAVSNDVNTGNTVAVDNSRGNTTVSAGGLAPTVAVDQSNDTKVAVESGDVDKSGNPMVNSGHGTAGDTVTANQGIEPTTAASTTGLVGGGSSATTNTDAVNAAVDLDLTVVDNSVDTGNTVVVDNSRGDTTISCGPLSVLCTITVDQSNNTYITIHSGDVNNSGNPSVGNSGYQPGHHQPGHHHGMPAHHQPGHHGMPAHHHYADCPDHHAAPVAHQPAARPMAPVKAAAVSPAPVKAAAVSAAPVKAAGVSPASVRSMSSAQPSSQLAYTGADVSAPLTVGLLTLTAGMGLAFATRRRSEAQAA